MNRAKNCAGKSLEIFLPPFHPKHVSAEKFLQKILAKAEENARKRRISRLDPCFGSGREEKDVIYFH